MKVVKITDGYVRQEFDTEAKKWVAQEFVAGDESHIEELDGTSADPELCPGYLPFEMVQPKDSIPLVSRIRALADLYSVREVFEALGNVYEDMMNVSQCEHHVAAWALSCSVVERTKSPVVGDDGESTIGEEAVRRLNKFAAAHSSMPKAVIIDNVITDRIIKDTAKRLEAGIREPKLFWKFGNGVEETGTMRSLGERLEEELNKDQGIVGLHVQR